MVSESAEPELELNAPAEAMGEQARIHDPPRRTARPMPRCNTPMSASSRRPARSKWMAAPGSASGCGCRHVCRSAITRSPSRSAGRTATTRYIVTPDRAYTPPHLGQGGRAAGIAVSLYGVRSARNWGCGDFTDLLSVIDWVADELDASFVALNPLHAIHNRRPFNTSPYLPNCIFYQNFLYLDVEAMEDFARLPARPGSARTRRRCKRRSKSCAAVHLWSMSGWRRSSCAS